MAKFFIINPVTLGTLSFRPGETIDDQTPEGAAVIASGALVWPTSDPIVAIAAVRAVNAHVTRGANEFETASIMNAGAENSQKAAAALPIVGSGDIGKVVTATSVPGGYSLQPGGGGGGSVSTMLAADFTIPASSGDATTAEVASTANLVAGQTIVVSDGTNTATLLVTTVDDLTNLEVEWTPAPADAAGGTVIATGSLVVPSGAPGANGTDGTDGTDGKNAYTTTTAALTIPTTPGDTTGVVVVDSDSFPEGAPVLIADGTRQGVFRVIGIMGDNLVLRWLATINDSATGSIIAAGARVVICGEPSADELYAKRLFASTDGTAPSQTTEFFLLGGGQFTLSPNTSYKLKVDATVAGTISGDVVQVTYGGEYALVTDGSSTITYKTAIESFDDPDNTGLTIELAQGTTDHISIGLQTNTAQVATSGYGTAVLTPVEIPA